jgi:hypothetical protein
LLKGLVGDFEELSVHAADLREFIKITVEGTRSEVALNPYRLLK